MKPAGKARILAVAAGLLAAPIPGAAEIPPSMVNELKPTVVNIEVSVQHGINTEGTGRAKGSGFIVDAERGIIATNRHLAGTSPSRIKVVFESGETAEARPWHHDAWHDFAFIKVEKGQLPKGLKQVRLGDSWKLKEQDDVLLIGNNDAQEYSVKFGKAANLYLCHGARHTATIQTTFDRAEGSSGSPVFDRKGEVIGIHFAGTSSTSFEMRVEYLKDALRQLTQTGKVRRGELGVELNVMLLSDARKHFNFPKNLAHQASALRKDIKRIAYVAQLAPRTPASESLLPGDLLLKAEGKAIGDDVYLFDKTVDSRVGGEVNLTVVRNGETLELRIPVLDAEAAKVRSFALFAGGVLHDVSPDMRLRFNITVDGVFLSQAEKGSSMAGLGREGSHTKYLLIISGVNGTLTPNLESFIAAVRPLGDGANIYMMVQDRWVTQSISRARPARLDLKYYPLRVFDWSDSGLDWNPR